MSGTLHLVGTPIGNLGDLSVRARETLGSVGLIAAEDTRRTGRLLRSIDVHAPLVSFFEGNERQRVPELVGRLHDGVDVALVTDGGMPSVSDPGYRLVRACVDAGIAVSVVPGPSAAIAALVVSGLPTDRFVFEGFLPSRSPARRKRLAELRDERRTMIVFESPRRVRSMLADLIEVMGDRPAALARELTKVHEEVMRGAASEILRQLGDSDPRGEVVVVVGGSNADVDIARCAQEARALVAGGMRTREAARVAAERYGAPVNAVYRALVARAGAGERAPFGKE